MSSFLFIHTEQEGKPIVEPEYYAHITRSDAEQIFRGDSQTNIPLLDERVKSLREAGKILLEKYQGTCLESLSEDLLYISDFKDLVQNFTNVCRNEKARKAL